MADPVFLAQALTVVSTDQKYALGAQFVEEHATLGRRVWRYIFNNNGAVAANLGVMQENGTATYEAIVSGANVETVRLLGITDHAIADASYGWVICNGRCTATAGGVGGVVANTACQGNAGGDWEEGLVGTDELPVWALETAAAGVTFAAIVKC